MRTVFLAVAMLVVGCSSDRKVLLTSEQVQQKYRISDDQFGWAVRHLRLEPEAHYTSAEDASMCRSLWTQEHAKQIEDCVDSFCPPDLSGMDDRLWRLEARIARLEYNMKPRPAKAAKEK